MLIPVAFTYQASALNDHAAFIYLYNRDMRHFPKYLTHKILAAYIIHNYFECTYCVHSILCRDSSYTFVSSIQTFFDTLTLYYSFLVY